MHVSTKQTDWQICCPTQSPGTKLQNLPNATTTITVHVLMFRGTVFIVVEFWHLFY